MSIASTFGHCLIDIIANLLLIDGCYLRRPEERQVVLDFLKNMQKTMGWKSQMVASSLEEQWGTLDGEYARC